MKNLFSYLFKVVVILVVMTSWTKHNTDSNILVKNGTEFKKAVAEAKPGDVIVMANGVWKDTELVFEGKGTKDQPITLTAEEPGKVTLEGASNLQISGEYLIVKGLIFKNGFTPSNEVISFRKNKKEQANNCRMTECVIDNYNNPERQFQDYWVAIYGKNNRIDHNHIVGKKNLGVTMIVGLDTKESIENNHKIDHNYFGPRPTYGNNGGETLRIGTSHNASENSRTLVESNYFDRCDGEHEIISNKSCQNTYKYNTFFECTGTLTIRHGNETLVDSNVFIGNGVPSTGGVRVINESQTVINNYHYGLAGYRFRGAFVMMNGVPNSPPNRYVPVINAKVDNNTFVNCDYIQLCAGKDSERSMPPKNSELSGNIFYNDVKKDIFTVYDDISGISFKDNILSKNTETKIKVGFITAEMKLVKNQQGFFIPISNKIKNKIEISPNIATKENTGIAWYSKADKRIALNSGKIIVAKPGINTVFDAAEKSNLGDIIELESGGDYLLTKVVSIKHPLTFKTSGNEKARILFERMTAFEIQNGGSLSLENLKFDGANAPDYAANAVISTSKNAMIENYKLFIDKCDFENMIVNHSFDVLRVAKGTFADTISIQNSKFKNITGHIAALDTETDDIGAYNVEHFIMKNNILKDIQGTAVRIYRGGTDESTFGPFLEIDHNVLDNIGFGSRNKYEAAISLYGVQVIAIENNIFNKTKPINMHLVVGEPLVNILNNDFYESGKIEVTGDEKYNVQNLWDFKPTFDGETYKLLEDSPLKGKGTDKLDLGILQ